MTEREIKKKIFNIQCSLSRWKKQCPKWKSIIDDIDSAEILDYFNNNKEMKRLGRINKEKLTERNKRIAIQIFYNINELNKLKEQLNQLRKENCQNLISDDLLKRKIFNKGE